MQKNCNTPGGDDTVTCLNTYNYQKLPAPAEISRDSYKHFYSVQNLFLTFVHIIYFCIENSQNLVE